VAVDLKTLGTAVASLGKDGLLDEVVRESAYERASKRGRGPGKETEDWYVSKAAVLEGLTRLDKHDVRSLRDRREKFDRKQVVLEVLVGTSKELQSTQDRLSFVEVLPAEWIRLTAYRQFEARGCQHGRDIQDWFNAKADLYERFAPLCRYPKCDVIWNHLRLMPLDHALSSLDMTLADISLGKTPRILQATHSPEMELIGDMQVKRKPASPDQRRRAATTLDPLSLLTQGQRDGHRGLVVAVALNNGRHATIIAKASSRAELRKKVADDKTLVDVDWTPCDVP
jgi:hypothetical protein